VPAGSLVNASLVGAKTVKEPEPFSVSTITGGFQRSYQGCWSAELTALSMMSFVGYICWQPITGCLESPIADVAASAPSASNGIGRLCS
jgi:hypothetical protein